MKKLIKMYNEKYGDTLGIIDDDFNKEQMYRIYYFIKNNCDDKDIQNRIKMINLDKPKTLEQQLTKLESENNKVIPSNNDFKEFTFDEELSTDTVKYVNINTLIPKTIYKLSNDDYITKRVIIYYRIPNSTDKIDLINIVLSPKQYEFYCNTLSKTKANIFVRSYIYSSVSYRITLGNTLDTCSVETKAYVLSSNNSFEFTPTREYQPTNKKYVDEKFLTGEIETIITIPKDELDKCNNGTNGVVSTQSFSKFDVNNYVYYAHYGDKVIKMTYDDRFNQLSIDEIDKNEGTSIGLLLQLDNNRILPFNSGLAEVQSYVFTNDIVITGNKLLKKYVDDNRDYYFKVPTILYDDPKLPKGYVDITTLEKGTNYRVNSSIVSGLFKVSLKAPNDDGTWFTVDDGSNTIGWSSMLSTSICVELKSDTFIGINMSCINNYCKYLSITKENGKWKIMQTKLNSISPDNMYEYDVVNDYNPTHKKYVDDKVSNLPQLSFNENGELVVTINGVSKTFVPKSE